MRNALIGIALCTLIAGCAEEENPRVAQQTVVETRQATAPGSTRVIQTQSAPQTVTRTETRVEAPSKPVVPPVSSRPSPMSLRVDTPPPVDLRVDMATPAPKPTSSVADTNVFADDAPTTTSSSSSEGYVQTDDTISVSGSNITRSIQANGHDVSIQGNKNHLTFSGSLQSLRISGTDNVITVENATSIDVAGKNNRVSWRGDEPRVSLSGQNNSVDPPLTGQDSDEDALR